MKIPTTPHTLHRLTILFLTTALIAVSVGYYFQLRRLAAYQQGKEEDRRIIRQYEAANKRRLAESTAFKKQQNVASARLQTENTALKEMVQRQERTLDDYYQTFIAHGKEDATKARLIAENIALKREIIQQEKALVQYCYEMDKSEPAQSAVAGTARRFSEPIVTVDFEAERPTVFISFCR